MSKLNMEIGNAKVHYDAPSMEVIIFQDKCVVITSGDSVEVEVPGEW